MSETTWEDHAAGVVNSLPREGGIDPKRPRLEQIETLLMSAYDAVDPNQARDLDDGVVQTWLGQIAALAIDGYTSRTPNVTRSQVEKFILGTIASKQHDYGPNNILFAGLPGVLVRMHDKVARIKNLARRQEAASNEAELDSWLDIAGYAIIALMLIEGTFESPLSLDINPAVEPTQEEDEDETMLPVAEQIILTCIQNLFTLGVQEYGWIEDESQMNIQLRPKREEVDAD